MKISIYFFFLLCSFPVFAQNNLSLSGTLFDEASNQPIIGGTVELLQAKDSTLVKGAISDIDGLFSFKDLSAGDYVLRVSYIGYTPLNRAVSLSSDASSVNLGKIPLSINEILLSEAVIEGKRPEMIVNNDTIEYHAASFKVTENAVIEDLLKKLPGVEVDNDGKVTVNGKEVKKFLVDNKEFFSDDPQVASKNLPAEMVEKLQVVDRKSESSRLTGFDDGEEETIINLTIKPGMKKGTMGNAFAGAGKDLKNDDDVRYRTAAFVNRMQENNQYTLIAGINNNNNMGAADLGANQFGGGRMRRSSGGVSETTNLMMRLNKEFSETTTLNGDVRYTGLDRFSSSQTEQVTLSETKSQSDKTALRNDYISKNVAVNFRLEWKPDTLNTLIFRPDYSYNKSSSLERKLLSRSEYDTDELILKEDENAESKGSGYRIGGQLTYAHKFANKYGRVFSTELRGTYNDNYSTENNRNNTERPSAASIAHDRRFEDDRITENFRGMVSWVEPVGHNNFIQALYRVSYNKSENRNSSYDIWDDIIDFDPLLAESIMQTDPTAELIPDQSRSTLRNATEQRIGLSFKSVRENFNYTIGFNVDPSNSTNKTYQPTIDKVVPVIYHPDNRLPNIMGDSLFYSVEQKVVNFSPILNFNYIPGRRANLRIDYEGETNQPSANQLRDFIDQSRPNNWVQGNPNLKPGYSNELRLRFQKYVGETQLAYNVQLSGEFSVNDIVSKVILMDDGIRLTGYENINGNRNVNLRAGFNTPLKNERFTVGSSGYFGLRNQNSYDNELKNTMKNTQSRLNANVNYRSALFDVGMRVNFNVSNIEYSIQTRSNQNTINYGISGYTTWYLPHNLIIESDMNWTDRRGYAQGYNIPEVMWNAAITKQIFNRSFGTGSVKLQVYDILQDRNNISSSYTDNGYRTSENNVIPSYFMCSLIYKFTSFPKSSDSRNNGNPERERRGPGGRGPGGPPMF
jgi:hypothetical protein